MGLFRNPGLVCLIALVAVSCSTTQSRYVMLGESYPPRPESYEVEVFQGDQPTRPYVKISRLDVHMEKTHFISSSLNTALPLLKQQARLSGADAIIDIRELHSSTAETKIYHVIATGIRYTDAK